MRGASKTGTLSVKPRSYRGGHPGGPGQEHFFSVEAASTPSKSTCPPGLPLGDGRPAPYRPSLAKLIIQCGQTLAPVLARTDRCGTGKTFMLRFRSWMKARGVPPELMPHLFRKYTRAGGSARGNSKAPGWGLAICKGLVEAPRRGVSGPRVPEKVWARALPSRFRWPWRPETVPRQDSASNLAAQFGPTSDKRKSWSWTTIRIRSRPLRDALMAEGYSPLMTGDPDEVPHLVTTEQPRLVPDGPDAPPEPMGSS